MKRTIRKVLCLLLLLLLFPMQTRGAVESETTAQSEKLRLDNENRYEGMEKAYQDGYEPEVSGESVSVILPLIRIQHHLYFRIIRRHSKKRKKKSMIPIRREKYF